MTHSWSTDPMSSIQRMPTVDMGVDAKEIWSERFVIEWWEQKEYIWVKDVLQNFRSHKDLPMHGPSYVYAYSWKVGSNVGPAPTGCRCVVLTCHVSNRHSLTLSGNLPRRSSMWSRISWGQK